MGADVCGSALAEFLRARREQLTPADVAIPDTGRRRVPGLRREELALLAGVSNDYYVRLEQGRDHHPSSEVLDALARALHLDASATTHLHALAQATPRRRRRRRRESVRPSVEQLLHQWPQTPAFVLGRRSDILAGNRLAPALSGGFQPGGNLLRAVFLDPAAHDVFPERNQIAADVVASLRTSVGADLDDPALTDLIGELSLKSEEFRRLWARHAVRGDAHGIKRFHHPLVGDLALQYESFTTSDPGQTLVVYHAKPDSPDDQALTLLASLTTDEPGPSKPVKTQSPSG